MIRVFFSSKLYYRICSIVLFAIAAAASFNGFFHSVAFNDATLPRSWYMSTFESVVDGTAYRPYAYRRFLPDAANWLDKVTPESFKAKLYAVQWSHWAPYINALASSPAAQNKAYFFRYLIFYLAEFFFAFLAVYAMYRVCLSVELPEPVAVFAPVIVILLVPYILGRKGYYYDFPEIAFFALAVWMSLELDWWWLVPLAALGTWNKESFLFFILTLYPLFRRRSSALSARVGAGVLVVLCGAIYYSMRLRFAHNLGSIVFFPWRDQLQLLLHPKALVWATKEVYGFPMLSGYTLLPIALVVWSVWRAWRHLPRAIQRHAQIAAAINIPLYLLFTQPGELRDLSMLYVTLLLVLAVNLNEWILSSWPAQSEEASYGKLGEATRLSGPIRGKMVVGISRVRARTEESRRRGFGAWRV